MATEDRDLKNPLAQTFGLALRELRARQATASSEMARLLGLGESTYRMIEAGSVLMQPTYALNLVRTMQQLQWTRVVLLLVAIQLLEQHKNSIEDMRRKAEEIQQLETELLVIMQKFDPVWEALERGAESSEISEIIKEKHLYQFAIEYMSAPLLSIREYSTEAPAWATSIFHRTPPLYLDLFVDVMQKLEGFLPSFDVPGFIKWEDDHADRFWRVFGIVKDPELLYKSIRDQQFTWRYVWAKQFDTINVLSLSEKPSEAHDELLRALSDRRKEDLRALSDDIDDENLPPFDFKKRVNFKSQNDKDIGVQNAKRVLDLMSYNLSTNRTPAPDDHERYIVHLQNVWLYQIKDIDMLRSIVLVDDYELPSDEEPWEKPRAVFTKTCTNEQTEAFLKVFKDIWGDTIPFPSEERL